MRAGAFVACVALLGALGASGLEAQTSADAAIRNCQYQALPRLRSAYPPGNEVRFAPDVITAMTHNQAAAVRGVGLVQEPAQLAWRLFSYSCYWKVTARQTLIVVRVDSARVLP